MNDLDDDPRQLPASFTNPYSGSSNERLLNSGEIVKDTDKYYDPDSNLWLPVEDEFLYNEFDDEKSRPICREEMLLFVPKESEFVVHMTRDEKEGTVSIGNTPTLAIITWDFLSFKSEFGFLPPVGTNNQVKIVLHGEDAQSMEEG